MGCMTGVQFLAGAMIFLFLFATVSILAFWTTQSPIQWVPETLSLAGKAAGA